MLRRPPDKPSLRRRVSRALATRGPAGTARVAVRYVHLRLRRLAAGVAELWFDRRLGVDTRGILYHAPSEDDAHRAALHYQGVTPRQFGQLMRELPVDPAGHCFIDLGCGKGKALLLAARHGFPTVLGVELSPELSDVARENLVHHASSNGTPPRFEVLAGDASEFELPREPAVIFLNNPFREAILEKVLGNVEHSLSDHPRPLFLLYMNPELASRLDAAPFLSRLVSRPRYVIYGSAQHEGPSRSGTP